MHRLGERTEQLGQRCGTLTQPSVSIPLLSLVLGALCLINHVTVKGHCASFLLVIVCLLVGLRVSIKTHFDGNRLADIGIDPFYSRPLFRYSRR
jgi:cobalamin synthase